MSDPKAPLHISLTFSTQTSVGRHWSLLHFSISAFVSRLIHALGNKSILRTKDVYPGPLERPAVEDLLRDTLIHVARTELGWDVAATADAQPERSVVDVFKTEINDFTKYRLAKAFVHWTRDHQARDLSDDERTRWKKLITSINGALR